MIRLCMFDLDGTLIDSVPDLAVSINRALSQYNLPQKTREEYEPNMGKGLANLIKTAIPKAHYSEELFESLRTSVIAHYSEHCTEETVLYEGIYELLRKLAASGIKLAVITNKPHVFLDKILVDLFSETDFVRVIGAGEYPSKPDPAALYAVMEETGVKKEECMYIGDTAIDINTAINAGIMPVGVFWGYQSGEALKNAGAQVVIQKPEELLDVIKNVQ